MNGLEVPGYCLRYKSRLIPEARNLRALGQCLWFLVSACGYQCLQGRLRNNVLTQRGVSLRAYWMYSKKIAGRLWGMNYSRNNYEALGNGFPSILHTPHSASISVTRGRHSAPAAAVLTPTSARWRCSRTGFVWNLVAKPFGFLESPVRKVGSVGPLEPQYCRLSELEEREHWQYRECKFSETRNSGFCVGESWKSVS